MTGRRGFLRALASLTSLGGLLGVGASAPPQPEPPPAPTLLGVGPLPVQLPLPGDWREPIPPTTVLPDSPGQLFVRLPKSCGLDEWTYVGPTPVPAPPASPGTPEVVVQLIDLHRQGVVSTSFVRQTMRKLYPISALLVDRARGAGMALDKLADVYARGLIDMPSGSTVQEANGLRVMDADAARLWLEARRAEHEAGA
jgi:hypothetical protein